MVCLRGLKKTVGPKALLYCFSNRVTQFLGLFSLSAPPTVPTSIIGAPTTPNLFMTRATQEKITFSTDSFSESHHLCSYECYTVGGGVFKCFHAPSKIRNLLT